MRSDILAVEIPGAASDKSSIHNQRGESEISPDLTQIIPKAQEENVSTEAKEILNSVEFTYALLAIMFSNVAHNDHNQFQNDEALKILTDFAKKNPDQAISENIVKLVEFSRTNKEWDRNYSFFSDVIRLSTAAVALGAFISENQAKDDEGARKSWHLAAESAQITSLAAQIFSSPITANKGYQAAITGHLANEMADAFQKLAEKIDARISKSLQIPPQCNHEHGDHSHDHSHDHSQGHSHSNETSLPIDSKDHSSCDHHHHSHAGSKQRHFGSVLNVASMSFGLTRIVDELQERNGSSSLMNDQASAALAIVAPILTIIGKSLSLWAAQIREGEVKGKIDTASKNLSQSLQKVFEETQNASLLTADISTEDAKLAILSELVAIGREAEKQTEEKRQNAGFSSLAKYGANYLKDSFYGLSYEAIKLAICLKSEILPVFGGNKSTTSDLNQAAQSFENSRSCHPMLQSDPASFSDLEALQSQAAESGFLGANYENFDELRKRIDEKYPLQSQVAVSLGAAAAEAESTENKTKLVDLAGKIAAVKNSQTSFLQLNQAKVGCFALDFPSSKKSGKSIRSKVPLENPFSSQVKIAGSVATGQDPIITADVGFDEAGHVLDFNKPSTSPIFKSKGRAEGEQAEGEQAEGGRAVELSTRPEFQNMAR